VTPDERWLAAVWPFVRSWLPASPARMVEIGCGRLGGFVPMLRAAGYDAAGVDPQAPDGRCYHRVEFERYEPPGPAGAVVACTSLHHVADIGEVLDRVESALAVGGSLVAIEWAQERFDEATARWSSTGCPHPRAIRAGCSSAMTSGRHRACPGVITAGPGRGRRDCTQARTSSVSLTPGLTGSCWAKGPISFPTWQAPVKVMSRRRSTPARSRPTASPTPAGDAGKGQPVNPGRN